ncbi:EmrB/QacA subfamily drug resistance transporter [Actinomadura pelletieri DSM 43383]|uniref:EmrB/QacA subfamily drug resistance transporter n=1 Tax=Actinomadura pelletieri DSM 43383 TaxID=1120940 RepID=A0A495QNC4_9ACTN|nr:MFS transporter [Actinomadura pelletieri]RKS74436.1 EmrB/QacA subfamily drug resistance transporter [Actinomadura pelletieri DSM 43383]
MISEAPTTTRRTQGDRSTAIVFVLCAAAFMAMLDVFVVNVAFTDIGRSFPGSSLPDLSWVLNAYTIVYAALLIPAGRLADRHGRKVGFLAGLALFTLASAACATAPTLWWLVTFRALQAAGAAALTPASLGLLLTALPPERRAGAVKLWATTSSLAGALGPVTGGALVQLSWQWVFLINLPIGILVFAASKYLLPESRDDSGKTPDLTGGALLAITLSVAALALVKGDEWGWTDTKTLSASATALIGLALFLTRIKRHPTPFIDPALFRVPTFAWANTTVLLFCTAFGAAFPCIVLCLQNMAELSPIDTGLAIMPGPLMVPIFAIIGQRLLRRVPPNTLIASGNLLFGAGAAMLATSLNVNYITQILPGWIVIGAGIGLALPTLLGAATTGLPPAQAATGSAVVNTSRQLGYVLGVAIFVAVIGTLHSSPDQTRAVFENAWWFIALTASLSATTALGIKPPPPTHNRP